MLAIQQCRPEHVVLRALTWPSPAPRAGSRRLFLGAQGALIDAQRVHRDVHLEGCLQHIAAT